MVSPVILADGYTYEESAIKDWLDRGKQVSSNTTCCEACTTYFKSCCSFGAYQISACFCRSAP